MPPQPKPKPQPPASGNPDAERVKDRARRQFQRWAVTYDRSWLNQIVFFPSIRACEEEIDRWQRARRPGPYRLLDVGCGTGTLLSCLAADPHAELLVGLDYAPEMARRAARKFAHNGQSRKLRVVCGDAERLPFPDASFDALTCCNSFHHYPNQGRAIAEFARVLRPGGLCVLVDGFRDNVIGWVVFDVLVAAVECDVHHAPWSAVRRMMSQAGFVELRQRKLNVLAPLLVSSAVRESKHA